MVTLISQPLGHKLDSAQQTAQIIDDGQGVALVYTGSAHGLADGDYVYIDSNFDSYNGFKYVDSIAYDSFKIKNSENGEYVDFVQTADIFFYISVLDHGFQCVHLPIVYELESDLSPVNTGEESYTPNTVVSQSDENGYTRLALSEALTNPVVLSKIQLVGDGPLAGSYSIITVYEAWNVVIDLAYSASNDLSEYQIVRYYDNYAINVNIYAGYPSDHRWVGEKPFELAATLRFIPDANNRIKFSISEVLRSYIEVRNNLTLDTLPNNTDFSVSFYIGYFESYDESDGEEITTFEGAQTTDDFQGWAINAKLPFKSEQISFLSDYINTDTHTARWLTLFDRPTMVIGYFFDLSFLNRFNAVDILIIVNGELNQTIENPGAGVIRVPLGFDSTGEYCVLAMTTGVPESGGDTTAISLPALSTGVNLAGSGIDWTTGASPAVTLPGSAGTHTSDIITWDYAFVEGYTYDITFNLDHDSNVSNVGFRILDASNNILYSDSSSVIGAGPTNFSFEFTAIAGAVKFGLRVQHVIIIPTTDNDIDINSYSATQTTPIIPAVPEQTITETICIDVVAECGDTMTDDQARLLEDDELRILE